MIKLFLKIAFIFLCFWFISKSVDLEKVFEVLISISPSYFIGSFLLLLLSQLFSSLRLRFYLDSNHVHSKIYDTISLYFSAMFLNIFLPGGIGGDGFKILVLVRKYSFTKLRAFQVALSERASGLFALFWLLFILSSSIWGGYFIWLFMPAMLVITLTYLLSARLILKESNFSLKKAFTYSFPIQIFGLISAYLLIKGLYLDVQLLSVQTVVLLVIFLLSSIAAIIPISIGGIGLRELTFLYLCPHFNVNPEIGITLALSYFGINLLLSSLGAFFLSEYRVFKKMD